MFIKNIFLQVMSSYSNACLATTAQNIKPADKILFWYCVENSRHMVLNVYIKKISHYLRFIAGVGLERSLIE